MKLHLPCALRGALMACFALACTAPTWADTEVSIDGITNTYILKDADTYTLTPASESIATGVSVDNISFKGTSTLVIGDASAEGGTFQSIEIKTLAVNTGSNLTIRIADNTTVYLNDVKFNNTVNYVLGTNSTLFISANDCALNSVSGAGNIYFTGGVVNATTADITGDISLWLTSAPYGPVGGILQSDIQTFAARYSSSGTTQYDIQDGQTIQFNTPTGNGVIEATSVGYDFTWNGTGSGRINVTADAEVAVIDPDTEIFRETSQDGKVWRLHLVDEEVSVQTLNPTTKATLGDITDTQYVKMQDTDILYFAGSILTSNQSVTLNNPVTSDGANAVRLAPAAGTTMTFTQGEGVLNGGNGLELSGGSGSAVVLEGVTTEAPEGIVFTTENTGLGIAGPEKLTMDASKNTFLATSHLSKMDGGTLVYVIKPQGEDETVDAIGSLSNASGTVELDGTGASVLEASTLNAGTLSIAKNGISVSATTVRVGDLTITDCYNSPSSITAATLTSTGAITLGAFTQLDATNLQANDISVGSGALLTGSSLAATGTTTVEAAITGYPNPSGIIVEGLSITGNTDAATLEDMSIDASSLSASGVEGAAIAITATAARSAGTVLSLGSVDATTISTDAGTTISNSSFSSSSITATDNLTLRGATFGPDTTITVSGTDATASFAGSLAWTGSTAVINGGATILKEGSISVGGTSYEVTDVPQSVSILGTATADTLTINALVVDLTGQNAPSAVILTSTGGTFEKGSNYFFDYVSDPGMVPYEQIEGNQVSYTLKDESDLLIAQLKTSENTAATADIISNYGMNGGQGELQEIFDYLRDSSRATLERRQTALEALVSGSVTMLADSQRRGVTDNINRLRNRVIQMGNPQGIELEKNVHGWISADGSYSDVDQDGAFAGYEYQTWGGTVGVHADVGDFSFGAAISASYGDLTSHASDHAEADHDTITVSAFARHQRGSWTQLGILSFGRNDIDMHRTVTAEKNPGKGESLSYTGDGDTSGHTITAYYEAGYTISLTEDHSQVLQPMVSLMLTSARMGDYTESGSIGNAGVCTDTEDYFYGTVGIGARYQIVLGTNVENRVSFGEVRARLVQDFGDETNETTAFFAAAPGQTFTVKGADVGRTGFQVGAGLSIPVGVYTTLFVDADADFRSGATSMSGSVGVRVEF